MRRLALVALTILLVAGCRSLLPPVDAPPAIQQLLTDFAGEVDSHHWNHVLGYFDPDYLARRRDAELGGRSGRFLLDELDLTASCPGGTDDELTAFACLDRVCGTHVLSFTPDERHEEIAGHVRLTLEPRCGGQRVEVDLVLRRVVGDTPHDWGFAGEVTGSANHAVTKPSPPLRR